MSEGHFKRLFYSRLDPPPSLGDSKSGFYKGGSVSFGSTHQVLSLMFLFAANIPDQRLTLLWSVHVPSKKSSGSLAQ